MNIDSLTGIDLTGELPSVIYKPGGRMWEPTTLPWMAFGYNLKVSPLQTLCLYNAVANGGKLMRPYLVSSVREEGLLLKNFEPQVVREQICSQQTLQQIKTCLEGVCLEGTAKAVFKNSLFPVAGKTGTAKVANGNKGYEDNIYQASFAGYFPADHPQYTCVVVIKNKPNAKMTHGAEVAGPVFREIADRLYSTYVKRSNESSALAIKADTVKMQMAGNAKDLSLLMKTLKIPYRDSSTGAVWTNLNGNQHHMVSTVKLIDEKSMPPLRGMGLKDALYLCESIGLKVMVRGKGKVLSQSIGAGQQIVKGQLIEVELN